MNLQIFSGRSNLPLSENIANSMDVRLGDIYWHNFPSGESYCQFKTNIRGSDVFLIQGITSPANENLMDLLIATDAARRASANRITAVIPHFGYARQDRKDKSRVPISAKLVMNMLEAAGVNRILTMDLHAQQVAGMTDMPVDQLLFEPVLIQYLKVKFGSDPKNLVIVAPDVGAVKKAERYKKLLNCHLALIVKNRLGDTEVEIESFVGDVKDKIAIITDDMTESASTLIQAAVACKKRGATKVICAITHNCITKLGTTNLIDAAHWHNTIDMFICSDTINPESLLTIKREYPMDIKVLSVAQLFGKAIKSIHNNESISELFI